MSLKVDYTTRLLTNQPDMAFVVSGFFVFWSMYSLTMPSIISVMDISRSTDNCLSSFHVFNLTLIGLCSIIALCIHKVHLVYNSIPQNITLGIQMLAKKYCVYQMTCPEGKSYIGRTNNIKNRILSHKNSSSCCSILFKAIKKHGFDNFKIAILGNDLTRSEANSLEVECIAIHNTLFPEGYNRTTGGESGYKLCSATRETILINVAKAKSGSISYATSEDLYLQKPNKFIDKILEEMIERNIDVLRHAWNLKGGNGKYIMDKISAML